MPVVDHNTVDEPREQANGEWRGRVEYIFDDGRAVSRRIIAPSLVEWTNLKSDLVPIVEAKEQANDAVEAVDPGEEVAPSKQANIKQVAVAYLRNAWSQDQAYRAYLRFDRFNTYRLNQGWTVNQVADHLVDENDPTMLRQEEWDAMKTAYLYLSAAGRPDTMSNALTIQGNWESR